MRRSWWLLAGRSRDCACAELDRGRLWWAMQGERAASQVLQWLLEVVVLLAAA